MSVSEKLEVEVSAVQDWVDDLVRRLGWHDRERAYPVLIATLHALRDSLGRNEAVYLGAQLPALLRGLYYEGWHPGRRMAAKSRDAFFNRIRDGVHSDPAVDAEDVARAVLALLEARLPAAEVEDAKAATPGILHGLWPD